MTIDPDVQDAAAHWGLDPSWLQSVIQAEGGRAAFVRAVRCSIPTIQTFADALDVLCRSTVHRMTDYVKANNPTAFVEYFGSKWAPEGVANDPTGLNRNWVPNVTKLWGASGA